MQPPVWRTLVSPQELFVRLGDPSVRLLDCRHALTDPEAGPKAYGKSHIPGAVHAHIDRDLSSPITPTSGRHPLPTPKAFRATCSRFGIGPKTQVVAYDDQGGVWAARAWWLLKNYGHDAVAVLDGGLPAWLLQDLPVDDETPEIPPEAFKGDPGHRPQIDAARLLAALNDPALRLLDARAPERFRGDVEPIDKVAGRIPGARNSPSPAHLRNNGSFRDPRELREHFQALLEGRKPKDVVAYCGSGVTACHILLAMEVAGIPGGRLYPGSWSEWIRDAARPIERGDAAVTSRIK